jgi:pimeloyl-ACP methyl ester carboxylesterase
MTRYDGLAAYAEAFRAAGSAVLAFDYRYFGDSGGDRRQHFSTRAQRADWRAAVRFARADERIDATRIVAWGFSFGAGFAIDTAVADSGIAAVVALCPFIDGLRRVIGTPPALAAWLIPRAIASVAGRHVLVPVAAEPGGRAALAKPGELAGFLASAPPESTWRNEVTPAIFLTVAAYRPVAKARRLKQPAWVGIADQDVTTTNSTVARFAARAPRAELHQYDVGDHFAVFAHQAAATIAADQVRFLRTAAVLAG